MEYMCYARTINGFGMGFGEAVIGVVEANSEKSAKSKAKKIAKQDGVYVCAGYAGNPGITVEKATARDLLKYAVREPKTEQYFMDILSGVLEKNGDKLNIKRLLTHKEEEALAQVFKAGKFTILGMELDFKENIGWWGVEDKPGSGSFLLTFITKTKDGG